MKKELVKTTLLLSPLEANVYSMVLKLGEGYNWQIGLSVFRKSDKKPKSISNSITSAVRQINRKFEKLGMTTRIVGTPKGRTGKLLRIEQ